MIYKYIARNSGNYSTTINVKIRTMFFQYSVKPKKTIEVYIDKMEDVNIPNKDIKLTKTNEVYRLHKGEFILVKKDKDIKTEIKEVKPKVEKVAPEIKEDVSKSEKKEVKTEEKPQEVEPPKKEEPQKPTIKRRSRTQKKEDK